MKQRLHFGLMSFCSLILLFCAGTASAQYCLTTGGYVYGCPDGDEIYSFSTTGGTTNISNIATSCSNTVVTDAYTDYSATMGVTAEQLQTVNITITAGDNFGWYDDMYKVFVDWNQDLDFDDAGEEVFVSGITTSAFQVFTGTITVPITATPGVTRMRVRCVYTTVPTFTACSVEDFGEIEDYAFTVVATSPCGGTPTPGNTVSSVPTVCSGANFTLSLQNPTPGSGVSYQWQSSPDGIAWSNVGTNSPTYTTSQTTATYYQAVVTCANGGGNAPSTPIQVNMSSTLNCFCVPTYVTGGTTDNIVEVSLGSMTNNTTAAGNPAPYYVDYTSQQPATIPIPDVIPGVTYPLTLTFGTHGTQWYGVWIDFDQDGTFNSTTEYFGAPAAAGASTPVTLQILVPANAALGLTRMRVRGGDDAALSATQACGATNNDYGESEDYLINILPIPSCLPPTNLVAGTTTSSTATFSWTASTSNPAFGYDYFYDVANTPPTATTTPIGSVGVGVTTESITSLSPLTTYYVWVRSNCSPVDQSPWSGPIVLTTQCAVFPAPFVESFNTNTTPQCWSNTGVETWKFNNTQPGYGPAAEHTGNSGYFAWVDDSSPNNIGTTLTSPIIDISTLTNPRLRFFIYSNNTNTPSGVQNDTLIVEAFDGTSWVHIDSITQNLGPQWTELTYSLATIGSSTVQLRFIVNENAVNNFYHDISIDDIYVESTPTCLPPTALTAGTATTSSISFSWTASTSNPGLGYEYYHSTSNTLPTATTLPTGTEPTGTSATVSGLPSGTPYYVWVRANCGGNDLSTWTTAITTATLITNDEAATAIPLTVNPDYDCGATTAGTTLGATASADVAPSCNPTGINDDVWYSFTATNTAHRVTLYGVTAVSNIALYSGTLGSLTEVTGACATNNSTTTAANIYATGLTVNSVYYVRVYTQTATASTSSSFIVCVGTSPTAAPANDICANAVNITNSQPMLGSNGGATEDITPCNANTLANDVWYTFTTGSVAGNVTVTGITTYADIVMEAFTGTCGNLTSISTCVDAPAIGTESFVIAALANTTYYVRVYGYDPGTLDQGTFTIQALGTPLAVKLSDISATNVGNRNRVDWITASETAGDRFELERSADGRNFSKLTTISARGEASTYSYWDEKPVAGVNYYRLRMMDAAGSFTYSDVVTAKAAGAGALTVEAYPNPVSEMLTVKVYGAAGNNPTVSVSDITGKVLKVVTVTNNEATLNMSGLAQGMYLVKYTDNNNTETIKVNKK